MWTTVVCAITMGDVYGADSNFAEQKGLFLWYIILLVVRSCPMLIPTRPSVAKATTTTRAHPPPFL